ncbi:MAG: histidine kinase [Sphingomicrobium sp.]
MNDQHPQLSVIRGHQRPPSGDEHPSQNLATLDLGPASIADSPAQRGFGRATVAIILSFWIVQYVGTSALVYAMNPQATTNLFVPRFLVSLGGVAISFAMVGVQNRLSDHGLSIRAILATILAFVAPAISVAINYFVFYIVFDFSREGLPTAADLVQDYLVRLWIFGSLSGIILALSYAGDIRERELRIHSLQQLAHSAQLRALRNQLSPHFLFNALNSIAALISGKRAPEAETMTENLADFLRMTLALDPQQLITLKEELRLQNLYLAIEQVRFPGRLKVRLDIPDDLQGALVPSLITQPLIENTIKYAVARSTQPVALSVTARRDGERLEVVIADDGGDALRADAKGAHLGLANVAERIRMHFGEAGEFAAAPDPAGGFRSRLAAPLRFAQ